MATTRFSKRFYQRPLLSESVRRGQFYVSLSLSEGGSALGSAASTLRYWHYCEVETVVEGFWARFNVGGTAAAVMLAYVEGAEVGFVPGPILPASTTTSESSTESTSSGTEVQVNLLTETVSLVTAQADVTQVGVVDATVNRVPAGGWIVLEFSGANVADVDGLGLTMRLNTYII